MATAGRIVAANKSGRGTGPASARPACRDRRSRPWTFGVLGFALAGLMALVPQISTAAQSTKELFKTLDMNGDNVIDRDEFNIQAMEIFYEIDSNKDGYLSRNEVLLTDAAFSNLDRESKGKVSGLTFIDSELMDFDRIDTDGNGKISYEEFEALVKRVRKSN